MSEKITDEQLTNWLGSDEDRDVEQLHEIILELVNGEWTPEQARKDILDWESED